MSDRRSSFTTQLVLASAILLGLLGAFSVVLTLIATRLHMATVDQSLNRNLAAEIVDEMDPAHRGRTLDEALRAMFGRVMALNPTTEVYLLDPEGRILRHAAPPEKVKRDRVDVGPVRAFLDPAAAFPLYGDDPRDPDRPKVFSAPAVREAGQLRGYLYVVLGGEAYRTVADMLESNHVLRLSLALLGGGVALAMLVGLLASRLLTRRLRALAAAMARFERGGFRAPEPAAWPVAPARGDEIDDLARAFGAMAARIADQLGRLAREDEARRELVMNISHDLKTPLATLQGYLETLLLRWEKLGPEQRRGYLRSALGFSQRLDQMIADLFELARLDMGETPLRPEVFSMGELVQDVCQGFRLSAEGKGVELVAEVHAPGSFVEGDIGLIERAMANLLDNAIKFTRQGGRVSVTVTEERGSVVTRVADTGVGIPAADIAKFSAASTGSGPSRRPRTARVSGWRSSSAWWSCTAAPSGRKAATARAASSGSNCRRSLEPRSGRRRAEPHRGPSASGRLPGPSGQVIYIDRRLARQRREGKAQAP